MLYSCLFSVFKQIGFYTGGYFVFVREKLDASVQKMVRDMWRRNPTNFWTPGRGIYVGLNRFAGYWAWLDNSTFDTSQ